MVLLKAWSCAVALLAAFAVAKEDLGEELDENTKVIPLRTHSLQNPFLDSQMQSRWWDFGGDTVVRTDKYVRLTGELPSRAGWIFSRVPLTATNWELEMEFKIEGTSGLYGDGMAIWLTKERAQGGPVFGFKDNFEGLAIFIDTYKNDRPGVIFPYIMAMMGDGKTPYDKDHDGKSNELAGCPAGYIRNNPTPTKLRIRYFHEKSLRLDIQHDPDKWTNCFTIPDLKIPSVAYLGFSAETGELADNHDIISVETRNLYMPESGKGGGAATAATHPDGKQSRRNKRRKSGGWGWWFFKFCLFGFLVAGVWVGFTAWRAQKNRSRF